MSRLIRFRKEPIVLEYDLKDEEGKPVKEKIVVNPFKTPDIGLLLELSDPAKGVEATHKVVWKVLQENIPDVTQAEYDVFPYAYVDDILKAVMTVNSIGSSAGDVKKRFLEEIKAKQQASRAKAQAKQDGKHS